LGAGVKAPNASMAGSKEEMDESESHDWLVGESHPLLIDKEVFVLATKN